MSKLDEIFSKNTIAATSKPIGLKDGMASLISFNEVIIDINKTKQDIKDLMIELIDDAHATTTTLNTMPLVSSYRAVDDMRKFARQKVDEL